MTYHQLASDCSCVSLRSIYSTGPSSIARQSRPSPSPTCSYLPSRVFSSPPDRFSRPGPIPLGDKAAQREMDALIEDRNPSIQLVAPSGIRGEREEELGPGESHEEVVAAADSLQEERHPDAEREPLLPFENDVNPRTGERGGPKGPEPTRYGDWERKGRVIDF
ncbi:hypothetical protein HDU93_003757 [Gonapodya sp. JEL0774]|nr:hypothetical protein HDU93_003757 [Gonapodya sp. JEL0774]